MKKKGKKNNGRKKKDKEYPLVYPGEGRTKYHPYTGYLTDFAVWVVHKESMIELFTYGSFGKGTLSRSYPEYDTTTTTTTMTTTTSDSDSGMHIDDKEMDDAAQKRSDRRVERERSGFHRKSRVFKKTRVIEKEQQQQQQQRVSDDFENNAPPTSKTKKKRNYRRNPATNPTPTTTTTTTTTTSALAPTPPLKCRGWWPPFNVDAAAPELPSTTTQQNDSSSDAISIFDQIRLPIQQEFLQLGLEEAFYLLHELACLKIVTAPQEPLPVLIRRLQVAASGQMLNEEGRVDEETKGDGTVPSPALRELSVEECFFRFCEMQPHFAASYAAYHHYRKRDWIPKSGLKYGGDFVLYRMGPAHYHAEWVVILQYLTSDKTDTLPETRKLTWPVLHTMNRAAGQVAKGLLLCFVALPTNDVPLTSPACLSSFQVQESVYERFVL